jgi:hypothetical protein
MDGYAMRGVQPKGEVMNDDYWAHVLPTYIENWPSGLYNLSIPQVNLRLPMPRAFLKLFELVMDGKPISDLAVSYLKALEAKINKEASVFPNGFFVRLGSRSPKDSWTGDREGFKCHDGAKALRLLLDSPERVYDDVALAVAHDYKPQIWLREWIDIPEWAEFRCFMKDRKLIGISKYDYLKEQRYDEIVEIVENADSIRWAIEKFFSDQFLPRIHLDSVVFDIWVKLRARGNEQQWEVRLLEINPFGVFTDPCLFSWKDGGDMDGSFKFITESAPKPNIDDLLEELTR